MKKEKWERLKTRILILLIITSVIQIGIHWNKQTQGLPFHFITQIFNENGKKSPNLDVGSLKEQYFEPETVVVSMGTAHWRLDGRDSEFEKIWKDIRDNYLPSMIKQKPEKTLPKEQWAILISSRSIRIDFYTKWPGNIVNWFEEVKPGDVKGFEGIKSIVIIPQADVNETVNTVYVYDEVQIYQYNINIKKEFIPKRYYTNLADDLYSKKKMNLRLLPTVSSFRSREDIYVSLESGRGREFYKINIEIPSVIELNRENVENYSIQDNILLNQKESLSANYTDKSDVAMFTDTENLYRLYKNGVLEYKFIPVNTAQAGEISIAFKHAITFIEQRRHLAGEADIVLTAIENNNNYYEMEFSYILDGVPLYYSTNQDGRIRAPISIKANSERILECNWAIRSFSKVEKPKNYNVDFADLLNKLIVSNYPELIESPDNVFDRIEPGYIFRLSNEDRDLLVPTWIISTDKKDYFIPLLEMGG